MSLNSTPITWVDGPPPVTAAQLNAEVRDPLTGIQAAWSTYTPTWSSTGTAPVLGNGTLTGRYLRIGKTLAGCEIILTLGSTSTVGTGAYSFSLPPGFTLNNGTTGLAAGSGTLVDASAGPAIFTRVAVRVTTTTVGLQNDNGTRVSATTPVVPAVGDIISLSLASLELA